MDFIPFLQAESVATTETQQGEGAPSASGTMGFMTTVLPFLLIIFIFYFFLIRPQTKKQKETEKMISALKKGDKVVTIGGIHGTVSSTKEKTIIIKVDDNCKMEFSRSAIAGLENPPNTKEAGDGKKTDDKKVDDKKASTKPETDDKVIKEEAKASDENGEDKAGSVASEEK